MALMHPMYNHLGRSPKKKKRKTASMIVAEKQHNAWFCLLYTSDAADE